MKVGLFLHLKCCPSPLFPPLKHPKLSLSEACADPSEVLLLSCFPTHLSLILGSLPYTLLSLESPHPHSSVLQTWPRGTDQTTAPICLLHPLVSPLQQSLSLPNQHRPDGCPSFPSSAFSINAFCMNKNSCHYPLSYKSLKECHQLPSCTGLIRRHTAPLWRAGQPEARLSNLGSPVHPATKAVIPASPSSLTPQEDRPPLTRSTKFGLHSTLSTFIVAVLSWRHWVYCDDLCLEDKTMFHRFLTELDETFSCGKAHW